MLGIDDAMESIFSTVRSAAVAVEPIDIFCDKFGTETRVQPFLALLSERQLSVAIACESPSYMSLLETAAQCAIASGREM